MKNKVIYISIFVLTLISFMIGFSYAYFTTKVIGNDLASSKTTTLGKLELNYIGTDYLSLINGKPGDTDSMTFSVTNSGTMAVPSYNIYFSKLTNTIINNEVVYTITCESSDANPCSGKTQTPVPTSEGLALLGSSIAPGTTHTYVFNLIFIDTGSPQNYNQMKEVKFKLTINEIQLGSTTMMAVSSSATNAFWGIRSSITKVTFNNSINIPVNAIQTWDISLLQDNSLKAFIVDDGLGTSTYELFIQADGIIYANANSNYVFLNFVNVTEFNNLNLLNTSNATTMQSFFMNCNKVISLDLSTFNTSKVTNMFQFFIACNQLTTLDVSNFDTSKVTNMQAMFQNCYNLTSLDLSSFNTEKVTVMPSMFASCNKITALDLSSFSTPLVQNMSAMFSNCNQLVSLNISNFNTTNVTLMNNMFNNCSKLSSLDLSHFNTINVTTMQTMFSGCTTLATLNISSFDTAKVTNMANMFYNCIALNSIEMRNATFGLVSSYTSMFTYVKNGVTITVKNSAAVTWITSRLTEAGKTGNVIIY